MRLLFSLLATAGLCLTALGQMNYANVSNQTVTATLPSSIVGSGTITYGPSMAQLVAVGWRTITNIASPTAGYAVDSYVITNVTATTCTLAVGTQHNIQVAYDAMLTNNPLWTTNFIKNAQTFRANLRAAGASETNAVVTVDTINGYIATVLSTNIGAVLTNLAGYIFMANEAPQLLILGQCDTTAHFPWRLIP